MKKAAHVAVRGEGRTVKTSNPVSTSSSPQKQPTTTFALILRGLRRLRATAYAELQLPNSESFAACLGDRTGPIAPRMSGCSNASAKCSANSRGGFADDRRASPPPAARRKALAQTTGANMRRDRCKTLTTT